MIWHPHKKPGQLLPRMYFDVLKQPFESICIFDGVIGIGPFGILASEITINMAITTNPRIIYGSRITARSCVRIAAFSASPKRCKNQFSGGIPLSDSSAARMKLEATNIPRYRSQRIK
jgi:hypothetical protein